LQAVDDSHRAERVGDHELGEDLGRHVGGGDVAPSDRGIDEQQIEYAAVEPVAKFDNLRRLGHIEGLDFDIAAILVGEACRPVRRGPRTVPITFQPRCANSVARPRPRARLAPTTRAVGSCRLSVTGRSRNRWRV
jgi:hypothetical protein